jgi:hypothetical protein
MSKISNNIIGLRHFAQCIKIKISIIMSKKHNNIIDLRHFAQYVKIKISIIMSKKHNNIIDLRHFAQLCNVTKHTVNKVWDAIVIIHMKLLTEFSFSLVLGHPSFSSAGIYLGRAAMLIVHCCNDNNL